MSKDIDNQGSASDGCIGNMHTACYSSLCDQQLLELISKQRDRSALAELYQRFKSTVGSFLKRKTCEDKLVDEVYNDVMLIVWENAHKFRGESKVSTWIFTIAYRIKIALSQKEKRHAHLTTEDFIHDVIPETGASLEETIEDAMLKLSEAHRTVIELSYFHGYNTSEIAAIVGCPQNTVKTRLFHARQKLKTTIEADQSSLEND